MRKKIKRLNTIATILVALQLMSYIGNVGHKEEPITSTPELIGYYIGSNFILIIAAILYIQAYLLRKKMKNNNEDDIINSIGKE